VNPISGLPLNPATEGTGNGLTGPKHQGTFTVVTVDDIDTVGGTP
jgi:hypothetical protein